MKKYSLFIFTLIALLGLTAQSQARQEEPEPPITEAEFTSFLESLPDSTILIDSDFTSIPNETLAESTAAVTPETPLVPVEFEFGTLSFIENPAEGAIPSLDIPEPLQVEFFDGILFDAATCASLEVTAPEGSSLSGFSVDFIANFGISLRVTLFDGDVEVAEFLTVEVLEEDTFDVSEEDTDFADELIEFGPGFFGFINSSDLNVTRIQICAEEEVDPILISGIISANFAFTPAEIPAPTCRDQLQSVIGDLSTALETAEISENDEYLIAWAISSLEAADSDALFETPDRLSTQGVTFFRKIFSATFDLENVSARDVVLPSLTAIQDVLSCLVDNEIAFAEENSGSDRLIAYAEFFDDNADKFADAELFLQATWLHFYAWLFAINA